MSREFVSPPPLARRDLLAAAILAAATFLVFARAIGCQFVDYDDPDYVTRNPHVIAGVGADGLRWAFTAFHTYNWHPLTWLSLQLDASLWGLRPSGFHFTNVLLHAANAALVFLALRALTGAFWRSAAAALLFAVHPLRVESVAWVSERKDVLSIFFGLLSVCAYAGYARRRGVGRYLAVAALLALSLMAKPTLVTLPCLMLVLDWWPLGRVGAQTEPGPKGKASNGTALSALERRRVSIDWLWLCVEKLPLLALSAASAAFTYRAQSKGGAVSGLTTFPLSARLGNAAISYVTYLSDTFLPMDLAVEYPHRAYLWGGGIAPAAVAAALVLLAAATVGAALLRARAPYLLTGWLWYAGTLVPVIGLVQVGGQSSADRYTYFPQIGMLLALCWGVADLARNRPRTALSGAAAAAAVLAALTFRQILVWQDSLTLWDNVLQTGHSSPDALDHLGQALGAHGRSSEAIDCYHRAIQLDPTFGQAYNNLGSALLRQGRPAEAAEELDKACRFAPNLAEAHTNRGIALSQQGKLDEAAEEHRRAIQLDPDLVDARGNLGQVELARHHPAIAADCYREVLRRRPGDVGALVGLGASFLSQGKTDDALACAREALRIDPASEKARMLIGFVQKSREKSSDGPKE